MKLDGDKLAGGWEEFAAVHNFRWLGCANCFLCSLLLQLASAIGYVIGCLILKFSVKIDNVAFVYDKINQVNKVENRTEFVVLKMIKYSTCACILNLLSHSLCKGGPLCSSIVDHHWLLSNSFELSA